MRTLLFVSTLLAATHATVASESGLATFPVPIASIRPGDTLTADMVVERKLVASGAAMRAHFTSRDSVVGKVARRPLAVGVAIPLNALRDAHVFKEGERVVVEYSSGSLSIRTLGVALQPGIVGQPVRVRNADTGVIVTGIARGDGTVEVQV